MDLPDGLYRYIERLSARYPRIAEIWLLGSRCTGFLVSENSDWDLLAFADVGTLDTMRLDQGVREPGMDLLVVTDGNCFEQPWIEEGYRVPKRAYLSAWGWKRYSECRAGYSGRDGNTAEAVMVWAAGRTISARIG